MFFRLVLMVLAAGLAANSERHSLTYTYTALSKPVELPGIHEFIAMGQLDGKMIDYFDSVSKKKVPKQSWMEENLPQEYWDKGSQSRVNKQQWFKVNIDILKTRLRQNDSDIHILQWRHGCEADDQPDGSLMFHQGIDKYSYDGDNFLYFDDAHGEWVAPVEAARETKNRWDHVQMLTDYTKGYLKNECVKWLSDFLQYQHKKFQAAPPPQVYLKTKNAKVPSKFVLSCMATGFSSKHTIMQIKRNDRVLTARDGVQSTGVRPNGDDTYQRIDHLEILSSDDGTYTCEVVHAPSKVHIIEVWEERPQESSMPIIIGGCLVLGLGGILASVVVLVLKKKGKLCNRDKKPNDKDSKTSFHSLLDHKANTSCVTMSCSGGGSNSSIGQTGGSDGSGSTGSNNSVGQTGGSDGSGSTGSTGSTGGDSKLSQTPESQQLLEVKSEEN